MGSLADANPPDEGCKRRMTIPAHKQGRICEKTIGLFISPLSDRQDRSRVTPQCSPLSESWLSRDRHQPSPAAARPVQNFSNCRLRVSSASFIIHYLGWHPA